MQIDVFKNVNRNTITIENYFSWEMPAKKNAYFPISFASNDLFPVGPPMTKMKEKLLQKSAMKTMKEDLFRWTCERLATNNNLDRDLLREKAIELTKIFGLSDFKCSNKWITNFLKEHRISVNSTNQPGPVFSNYRDWIDMMRSTIVKYKHRDLFHVDELGMYSDVLPSRISSSSRTQSEKEGGRSSRNRITVLMGCNSSGTTKLPLLICGPYPSRTTTRDHVYCHSEDSSISDELFRDWLTAVNDRMLRCDRNILLFLRRNRARAIGDLPLSHVNLVYLPGDFPPMLRPLRRDIFHYVKMIFRRRYAERMKRRTVEWNLRDILESLIDAWETVPREIVICSFQRTHFRTDDRFLQIDCDCWDSLQTGISFKRFVTFDDDLSDKPIVSSRFHGYNLRAAHKAVVQINEGNEDSARDGEEARSESVDSKDRVVQNLDRGDKNGNKKPQTHLLGNLVAKLEAGVLGSRSSGDSQFPRKRESVVETTKKSAFAAKDIAANVSHETFKRDTILLRDQTESCNIIGSVQEIIDKALTLTTTAKADYARKLIESIYASNEEAKRSSNEDTGATSGSLAATPRELNRTSVSFNHGEVLSEMITQDALKTTKQTCTFEGTVSDKANTSDTDTRREMPDENLTLMSDVQQAVPEPVNKKRRMSSLNGSGNDTDNNESDKKKLKTYCDWSKQFETTFVFGPPGSVNCSPRRENNGDVAVSYTFDIASSSSPRN